MLEIFVDTLCGPSMCYSSPRGLDLYHEPLTSKRTVETINSEDDESSYSPNAAQTAWRPDYYYPPSEVPAVIHTRSLGLTASSSPERDGLSTVASRDQPTSPLRLLSSSKRNHSEITKTPPPYFRRQQRDNDPMRFPPRLIKKANPIVMKDYDDDDDDDTVSTQSSYSLTSCSPLSRMRKQGWGQQQSSSSLQLNWNDAVVEDTAEGFKIHGPPEIIRSPVLLQKEEDDWGLMEPPTRTNQHLELGRRLRCQSPSYGVFAKERSQET